MKPVGALRLFAHRVQPIFFYNRIGLKSSPPRGIFRCSHEGNRPASPSGPPSGLAGSRFNTFNFTEGVESKIFSSIISLL